MDYFRSKTALFENSVFGRVKKAFAGWAEQVASRVHFGVTEATGRYWRHDGGDMIANAIQYGIFMKTEDWDQLDLQLGLKDDKVTVRISFESRTTRERKSKVVSYDDTMDFDRVSAALIKECAEFWPMLPKKSE